MTPLREGGAFRVLTERDPEALDVLRHSAAHILATAVRRLLPDARSASVPRSRTASTTTSRCRGRSRPRTSSRSRREMAEVTTADYPFVREEVDRAERQPAVRRRSAQARADQRAGRRRDHLDLHRRSVHRPLPRPARARAPAGSSTSSCCTPPARTGGATRSARCCSASTAPRSSRRTSSTPISTGWRRRGSATTARSARSSTCSCSIRSRRARRSGPTGARRSTTLLNDFMRELQRERLPGDQDAAALQQGAVGDLAATGASTGRTCSSCSTTRPGSTTSRSSR